VQKDIAQKNRLLAEPISVKELEGGVERKGAAYLEVREDLNTAETHKLQTEIELHKKSNKILSSERLFWLCLFGGVFGLHSFVAKRKLRGFLQLFSFSLFGFWWLYDLGLIVSNKFTDGDNKIIYFFLKHGETGNFTIRFIAFTIDFIILNFIVSLISFIIIKYQILLIDYMTYSLLFLDLGIYLLYFFGFSVAYHATPGKIFMHLRIETKEGGSPSKIQLLIRYFAYFISQMLAMLGFIMILFRKDRLALHDIIAESKIVYTGEGNNYA
jgi:uncharacterized RDD family membrane protein YckC